MKKERVDVLLVQQGFYDTREQAKRAVMAGQIYELKSQERLDKPGVKIDASLELEVKGEKQRYVSRGGFKLEKAITVFNMDLQDKIVLDIGSSTGGFTDCALQNGAKMSYALDVGSNQLAWKLRQDPRVTVMEKTNFRYSQLADFTEGQPDFATIDVSFISLHLILPVLRQILAVNGHVMALIKPQFEAGKDFVGKHGIVRDAAVHTNVLTDMLTFSSQQGYCVEGLDFSPIKGGEGNIEFIMDLRWTGDGSAGSIAESVSISAVQEAAYAQLNQ